MAKNGMNPAGTLYAKDIIEVPIEACEIVSITPVPGQLRDRRNRLLKLKVVPLSGPWANCEGEFVLESSDLVAVVRKHTVAARRKEAIKKFFQALGAMFRPKVTEVPKLEHKLTGNYT